MVLPAKPKKAPKLKRVTLDGQLLTHAKLEKTAVVAKSAKRTKLGATSAISAASVQVQQNIVDSALVQSKISEC
ncbi:unnamed protein product [Phytophthora fragariaefolia]|uniref:Unnamed protein product n=1 Tax=Phytophthora fragariaefolia TaxID=1490495 RepID=A0A9W6XSA9_9STRA|nr:unnamed protein product [Phytophthora fragariaefolia]